MNTKQIIQYINALVIGLHGLPIDLNSTINQVRLEPYAMLIVFYQLNLVWPCFDSEYASDMIINTGEIKAIVNKAIDYDITHPV